jgi:VCBS repeat-containing protein
MVVFPPARWFRSLFRKINHKPYVRPRSRRRERTYRPEFELLEDRTVPSNNGTLHLTDITATTVEDTHYAAKTLVYAYGNNLVDGYYDVEVVAPGGKSGSAPTDDILGLSDPNHPVQVVNGHFFGGIFSVDPAVDPANPPLILPETVDGPRGHAFNVWDVVYSTGNTNGDPPAGSQGFDDTDNPGGEYQVVIAQHILGEQQDNFTGNNDVTKSKNFKVKEPQQPQPPDQTQVVTAYVLTYPDGQTTVGPASSGLTAPLGSTVTDTATVTDTTHPGTTPTGGVDFQLSFSTDGVHYTVIADSGDVTLSGGIASYAFTTPLAAGSYNIVASFTDGTQFDESESTQEPFTINQGSSQTATAIFDSTGGPVTNLLGESVYDTATVSTSTSASFSAATSPGPFTATGTVTYEFFTTSDGTGPHKDKTVTLNPDGTVPNSATTAALMAGSYSYVAIYSGDSNYAGSTGAVEPLTIHKADTTTKTKVEDGNDLEITGQWVSASTVVHDNASVTSSNNSFTIGGTVTYTLYLSDGTQVGQPETVKVGTESTPTGPLAPGHYYYVATYNGDGNYNGSTGDHEPFQINAGPLATGLTVDCIDANNYTNTTVLTSDPDNGPSPLVATVTSGPSHASSFTFNADGTFSYTMDSTYTTLTGAHPTDSFSYYVSDGLDQSATVTVKLSFNRAPLAVTDVISAKMNVAVTGNVLTNDTDPDGDSLIVCAVNGCAANVGQTINLAGGSTLLVNADGTFTYTPGPDFHGAQSFSYTVCDPCDMSSTVNDPITVTSGALTQGYWKNHQSVFDGVLKAHPNVAGYTSGGKLLLGGAAYTSSEAIALMQMSTGTGTSANALLMVWQQLVAAKLNVLNGVTPDAADLAAIADADAAIIQAAGNLSSTKLVGGKKGQLTWAANNSQAFVAVSSTLGQQMVKDNNVLDAFNSTGV